MNNGIMPNGNIIAYMSWRLFVGGVNYGTILDIYLIPYFYIMHIASYYGIKPNTALTAHGDIAYNGCIFGYIAIFRYMWIFSVYGFDNLHLFCLKKAS